MPGRECYNSAVAEPLQSEAKSSRGRALLRKLLVADNRPAALAAAVALGIFLGCSPFYGFQTLLVLALAAAFRLNPGAAFLGSQVSFPPINFALVGAEVALGEWLRYGRWSAPKAAVGTQWVGWLWHHALVSWALGAVLIGGALAALGGLLVWALLVFFKAWRAA